MTTTLRYRAHTPATRPGPLGVTLPRDLPGLARIVQGLVIHGGCGHLYGVDLPAERFQEGDLPTARALLERAVALDPAPITTPRPPERRLVGHCRVAALLMCALAREAGHAARVRAGYTTYAGATFYGVHFLNEVWLPDEGRWTTLDPELDDVMSAATRLDFDPYDVPPHRFRRAARAWREWRAGEIDAQAFGFDPGHRGPRYLRRQLLMDAAGLIPVELNTEAWFGLSAPTDEEFTPEDAARLDELAARIEAVDGGGDPAILDELRAVDKGLGVLPGGAVGG